MINIKTIKYANNKIKNEFRSKKHYNLIILIIASRSKHYDIFAYCWLQYMNSFPNVRSFFLFSDENLEQDLFIDEHSIIYKCKESYIPGILFKTIAAERFCQKYMSYEYILRTNLSSFIHIPRLVHFLLKQPKSDYLCGSIEYFPLALEDKDFDENDQCINKVIKFNKENWKSHTAILKDFYGYKKFFENNKNFYFLVGYFIIMSSDVVDKLLHEIFTNNILIKNDLYKIPDDLVISAIVQMEHIQPKNLVLANPYSIICNKIQDPKTIDENIFLIRNRTDYYYKDRNTDVMNFVKQVRYFYNLKNLLFNEDEDEKDEKKDNHNENETNELNRI